MNLSSNQFFHPDLVDLIEETLASAGLDPGLLVLEVDEAAALLDAGVAEQIFADIGALGVATTLDRFAARQISLPALQRFAVEKLKIDRHLLVEPADGPALLQAAARLGTGFGKRVVGVGAETQGHLALLRQVGCDQAQGNGITPPLPLEDLLVRVGSDASLLSLPPAD